MQTDTNTAGLAQMLSGGAMAGLGGKAFYDAQQLKNVSKNWDAATAKLLEKIKDIDAPSGTGQKLAMTPELADEIAETYYKFSNKALNKRLLGVSVHSLKHLGDKAFDKYLDISEKLAKNKLDNLLRASNIDPKVLSAEEYRKVLETFGKTPIKKSRRALEKFMAKLTPVSEGITHSQFYHSRPFSEAILHHLRDYQHLPRNFIHKFLDTAKLDTPTNTIKYVTLSDLGRKIGLTESNINIGTIYNKLVDYANSGIDAKEKDGIMKLLKEYESNILGVPGVDARGKKGYLALSEHLLKEQGKLYSNRLAALAKYSKLGAGTLGAAGLGLAGYGAYKHFNNN